MIQSPEQTTNKNELQPDQTFDLSRVAIDHVAAPQPSFEYHEINNSVNGEEYLTGTASIGDINSPEDEKSATSFIINTRGEVEWNTGDKIALVVVREHGDATELGSDGAESGVIQDLKTHDEVYVISKDLTAILKKFGRFNKDGIATTMSDPEVPADFVRVQFTDALVDGVRTEAAGDKPSEQMMHYERRQNAKRIRDERNQNAEQELAANFARLRTRDRDVVSPVDVTQVLANDEELQEQIDGARGFTVTDKRHRRTSENALEPARGDVADVDTVSSLGVSDAIQDELELMEKERLAERVEKYTEKVATYEEIATVALGKRMKGRLFNPLTRKNKEKVQQDDLNMHLLEGFSRALDGALMKQWLAEGYSDDEAAQMIYEHQQTRQEARAARNHAELTKGKLGSVLDKYANMSKGKKIGVAIGAAAAFGTIGLVAGGALGVVGGIGLAGAKVGKSYFQHRSKIYETSRDSLRKSPDVVSSVSNGKATTRTAAQQVFAGMDYDEKKRETAIQKADRNKKVAVGVAALSAVMLGAGIAMQHGGDIQELWNKTLPTDTTSAVGEADGSWVTEAPAPTPVPAPAPAMEFSIDASTVTNGEGWYQTIQEVTGPISAAEQAVILQKIGPALQEKGWAYSMNGGTSWGISRPGTLPKDVLELIKNSR